MLGKRIVNYSKALKSKNFSIAVWGAGYIGLSTMTYFAKKKIKCVGYDVNKKKVIKINRGILPIPELKSWFGFDIKNLVRSGYLRATNNYTDLINKNFIVHFIAIPTEKGGKPYYKILFDVLSKIIKLKRVNHHNITPIVIVESTLTPKFSEEKILPFFKRNNIIIGKDLLYAVAPRRDWFVEGTKNIVDIDRVYGSTDKNSSKITHQILSIICNKLHEASSHKVSEMVKSVENAYRHMEITLANQLSLAYPKENMREVLKLVGTKWNIGTFYPGFGTGGYCIPLSSKYVLQGVKSSKKLSLLRETVKYDNLINILIAKSIIKKGFKNIGILGLSYKGNLKVSILSPVIPFIKELKKKMVNVKIYDPFFSKKEIKEICGIDTFSFPQQLKEFDCLVISVDHDDFKISKKILEKYLRKKCKYILDNTGVWKHLGLSSKLEYHISGDKNWL
jgi:nucleotide sugar dehydrogenase